VGASRLLAAVVVSCSLGCSTFSGPSDDAPAPSDPAVPATTEAPEPDSPGSDPCEGASLCDDFDSRSLDESAKLWGGPDHNRELLQLVPGRSHPSALGIVTITGGVGDFDAALDFMERHQKPQHIELRFDFKVGACKGCLLARLEQANGFDRVASYAVGVSTTGTLAAGADGWLVDTELPVQTEVWHSVVLVLDPGATTLTLDGVPGPTPPDNAAWGTGDRMDVIVGVFRTGPSTTVDVALDNVRATISE
jgi:hypothetical protein